MKLSAKFSDKMCFSVTEVFRDVAMHTLAADFRIMLSSKMGLKVTTSDFARMLRTYEAEIIFTGLK